MPASPQTPAQLNDALRAGTITYQQYQDGIAAYNGVPNPGSAPAAPSGPAPDVPPEPDQSWMAPPPAPAPMGPAAGSPEEKAQTAAAGREAAAARAAAANPGAAPPTAAAGAAQMQGAGGAAPGVVDPRDAALSAFMSPRAAPAHAAGGGPADRDYLGQLKAQGEDVQRTIGQAVEQHKDAVDAFQQQTQALATESEIGRVSMQKELEDNARSRAQLLAETKERQTKIDARLSSLEAQGVNPNHYWQSLSTGQKIGAAVAIGLSAFGAHALGPRGGGGGPNTALEIINGAIAQDIDAQKTNLQKSLEVAGKQMSANAQGFDQQHALLLAERDSIQTAYTVAQNDIARRAALYKDNADIQSKATAMIAGLGQSKDERLGAINDRIYGVRKRQEALVGGGEDPRIKQIRERAIEIRNQAAAHGKDVSPEEARRQAAADILAVDVKPGVPMASYAAPPPKGAGGGALSPRLVTKLGELNSAEQSVGELNTLLRQGSGLSPTDRAKAAALVTNLRNQGFTSLPEQPLGLTAMGVSGALATVLRDIKTRKQTLMTMGAGGGDSPEDLGLEEDR